MKPMKITFNQAVEILMAGDENKAWEVAQQDDGLLPGVTREQWLEFAKGVIERRKLEPDRNSYAGLFN